jgi:hypothetical protein
VTLELAEHGAAAWIKDLHYARLSTCHHQLPIRAKTSGISNVPEPRNSLLDLPEHTVIYDDLERKRIRQMMRSTLQPGIAGEPLGIGLTLCKSAFLISGAQVLKGASVTL